MKKTIEQLEEEFKSIIEHMKKDIRTSGEVASIDLSSLKEIDYNVYDYIINNPKEAEIFIRNAFSSVFLKKYKVHYEKISNDIEIGKIRVADINKLFSVKGLIKRTTKILPKTELIKFECGECKTAIIIPQDRKRIRKPRLCSACGSEDYFSIINEELKDVQEISLEEIQDKLDGKPPQQIRVYLEEELTEKEFSGKLQPGRKIEIIGTIEKVPAFMTQKDQVSNISEFILRANNILNIEGEEDLVITEEDERQIKEIAMKDPLKALSENLAPEVYGNEQIKRAIVLQMVKGVANERTDGTFSREDIHILLCGDPGIAKSLIMKSSSVRCPKSRMIVGTKTSRVGLGAMCVKDEMLGTWSLECGSLVLCSGSLLMLDEIDKLHEESINELLEPMSSGVVTFNRAGIFATLPSRTSILASANPIHGAFDEQKNLASQIDLPSPILNRFDLIFVLKDKPNPDFDSKAVQHIFDSYKKKTKLDISIELFKKYIIYAKRLNPELEDIIAEKVKDFYNNLRMQSEREGNKGVPINLRNIEALKRLAEANAKLRLSPKVEEKDFNVAKEIFMYCLKQIGYDNSLGIFDQSRTTEKIPVSKRGKLERLLRKMKELENKLGKYLPIEEIKEVAKELDVEDWELEQYFEELKKSGNCFEPKPGVYQII
jgi:replicative DNA helicase Mcm